jgi:tetratricopeptide (TPR) repeat protein
MDTERLQDGMTQTDCGFPGVRLGLCLFADRGFLGARPDGAPRNALSSRVRFRDGARGIRNPGQLAVGRFGAPARRLGVPFLLPVALVLARVAGAAPPSPAPPTPEYESAFHRGDYAGARALATKRLSAVPTDAPAQIVAARADAALGRFDAAYDGFRKALQLDPKSADALYYLGLTAGVLAQAELDRVLSTAPTSARAHQLRAQSLEAMGRGKEAEAEYRAAIDAGPVSADVLVSLAELRRGASDFAEAASLYTRALALAPSSYDALYGLGACLAYEGRHPEAIGLFRRALASDPASAPARLALGISLVQMGDAEAAVVELREAARLEPRMRQAHYQLGRACQSLGRTEEAQAAFARAQDLLAAEREQNQAIMEKP